MEVTDGEFTCPQAESPNSEIFFQVLSIPELVLISVAMILTVGITLDFVNTVLYILRHYRTSSDIKYKSIQLNTIYPVVAIASFLALVVPRAALLADLMRSVIVMMCILQFTSLITHYFGGQKKQLELLRDTPIALRSPPFCCCFCLPTVEANDKVLKRIKIGVLQGFIAQPVLLMLIMVLWLDNKYTPGKIAVTDSFIYMTIISTVSTIICLYSFILFFRMSRQHLFAPLRIMNKFMSLQAVVILTRLQGTIFDILVICGIPSSRGYLSSEVLAAAYNNMLLILEMTVLTLYARRAYRHPHEVVADMIAIEKESENDVEQVEQAVPDSPGTSNPSFQPDP